MTETRGLIRHVAMVFMVLVVVASCFFLRRYATAHEPSAKSIKLDEIVKSWRQRSSETKTVRVTIEVEETNYYGSPELRLNPPPDLKYENIKPHITRQRVKLCFDDSRARVTVLNSEQNRLEKDVAYDGKIIKSLFPEVQDRGDKYPFGMTRSLQRFRSHPYTLPPMWFYRMLSAKLKNFELGACEITARREGIDGMSCAVLVERPAGRQGPRENEYWLAPDLDFAVVRYIRKRHGKTLVQMDIVYKRKDTRIEPDSWKWTKLDPLGRLEVETKCRISHLDTNGSLPDSEFSIDFPVGAVVRDHDQKSSYIVRLGGRRRVITKEEQTATYSQALNSESGQALKP